MCWYLQLEKVSLQHVRRDRGRANLHALDDGSWWSDIELTALGRCARKRRKEKGKMIAFCTGSDVYLEGSLCAQDQNILANAFPRRTGEGHEDVVVSSYEELGIRGLRRLPERQSNRLGQGQHHLDPLRNENLLMKSAHLRQTDGERQQPRRDTFWSQASGGVRAELGSLTHQREKCFLPFF